LVKLPTVTNLTEFNRNSYCSHQNLPTLVRKTATRFKGCHPAELTDLAPSYNLIKMKTHQIWNFS